jgi:hypothetical protein
MNWKEGSRRTTKCASWLFNCGGVLIFLCAVGTLAGGSEDFWKMVFIAALKIVLASIVIAALGWIMEGFAQ